MLPGTRIVRAVACGSVVALLGGVAGCQGGRPAPPRRPNVVIYLIDALRRDHVGAYGYARGTSPSIDAFAREAVLYVDAYSTTAWTKPAVASLLTGLNPPRHGVQDRRHYLPESLPVLSEYLKALGYSTTAVVTNPHASSEWGFGRGFDRFDERRNWQRASAEEVNDAVFRSLGRDRGPFFYYIHTIEPHGPSGPKPPYGILFGGRPMGDGLPGVQPGAQPVVVENAIALYDGAIRSNDREFGLLLHELKRKRLYDDTLIILVADHGEEHLDHGKGGHGQQLFNEVAQIPMIVKFPKGRFAGTIASARASLLDIVPTVLSVAGMDQPLGLEGIDLADLPDGGASPTPDRRLFLDLNQVRLDGELVVARAVVEGHVKYMDDLVPEPKKMLFDLERDPGETNNLIQQDPVLAERLAALLKDYQVMASVEAIPKDLREPLRALGYIN
jgi:arylsulfatase A-like enzyme